MFTGDNLGLQLVDGQAQRGEESDDGLLLGVELALAVAEQDEVVHIAQVGRAA